MVRADGATQIIKRTVARRITNVALRTLKPQIRVCGGGTSNRLGAHFFCGGQGASCQLLKLLCVATASLLGLLSRAALTIASLNFVISTLRHFSHFLHFICWCLSCRWWQRLILWMVPAVFYLPPWCQWTYSSAPDKKECWLRGTGPLLDPTAPCLSVNAARTDEVWWKSVPLVMDKI